MFVSSRNSERFRPIHRRLQDIKLGLLYMKFKWRRVGGQPMTQRSERGYCQEVAEILKRILRFEKAGECNTKSIRPMSFLGTGTISCKGACHENPSSLVARRARDALLRPRAKSDACRGGFPPLLVLTVSRFHPAACLTISRFA